MFSRQSRPRYTSSYHNDDHGPIHGSFARDDFRPFTSNKRRFQKKILGAVFTVFVVAIGATMMYSSFSTAGTTSQVPQMLSAVSPDAPSESNPPQKKTDQEKLDGLRKQAADKVNRAMKDVASWWGKEKEQEKAKMKQFQRWVARNTKGDKPNDPENPQPSAESLFQMLSAKQAVDDQARKEAAQETLQKIISDVNDWMNEATAKLANSEQGAMKKVDRFYGKAQWQAEHAAKKTAEKMNYGAEWLNQKYGEADGQLSKQQQAAKQRIHAWYSSQQEKIGDAQASLNNLGGTAVDVGKKAVKSARKTVKEASHDLRDALKDVGAWLDSPSGPNHPEAQAIARSALNQVLATTGGDIPPDADAPAPIKPLHGRDPSGPPPDNDAPPIAGEIDPSVGHAPPSGKKTSKKVTSEAFVGRSV